MANKISKEESNPIYQEAMDWSFGEWSTETGLDRIVAYGEMSHKCPVYVNRMPPCQNACPANEDIRGYNNLLRGVEKSETKWEDAWRRIVDKNPFPAVMGRVCPAPCQSGCNRQYVEDTVGINSIEHALGDFGIEKGLGLGKPGADTGKHIAVVGAGPAGLSCAYQLRRIGHKVTIYEAQKKLGGMVRYGIMGYRVDRGVLDTEIKRILDLGVDVKTGVSIGKDISLDQLRKDHDAVFLGLGAQKGRDLPIPAQTDVV